MIILTRTLLLFRSGEETDFIIIYAVLNILGHTTANNLHHTRNSLHMPGYTVQALYMHRTSTVQALYKHCISTV